jgi:hypothetical protein
MRTKGWLNNEDLGLELEINGDLRLFKVENRAHEGGCPCPGQCPSQVMYPSGQRPRSRNYYINQRRKEKKLQQ